jgi:hypothetical protein
VQVLEAGNIQYVKVWQLLKIIYKNIS